MTPGLEVQEGEPGLGLELETVSEGRSGSLLVGGTEARRFGRDNRNVLLHTVRGRL